MILKNGNAVRVRRKEAGLDVASLVGFGSVVAALPAFAMVRDWELGIEGGPLVSLAVATNVLAALTGIAPDFILAPTDAPESPALLCARRQRHLKFS